MVEIKITREFTLEVLCSKCRRPLFSELDEVNGNLLVLSCAACDQISYNTGFSDGKFEARRG